MAFKFVTQNIVYSDNQLFMLHNRFNVLQNHASILATIQWLKKTFKRAGNLKIVTEN